jgi:hypothetical protein
VRGRGRPCRTQRGHTSAILRGRRKPNGKTIARLCAALALVQTVSVDVEGEAIARAEASLKK